jgi:hypothetical protein
MHFLLCLHIHFFSSSLLYLFFLLFLHKPLYKRTRSRRHKQKTLALFRCVPRPVKTENHSASPLALSRPFWCIQMVS